MNHTVEIITPEGPLQVTIHNDRVSSAIDEEGNLLTWDELPFLVQQRLLSYIHGDLELRVIR